MRSELHGGIRVGRAFSVVVTVQPTECNICAVSLLYICLECFSRYIALILLSSRDLACLLAASTYNRTLVPRHENGDAHLDDSVDLKQTWKAVRAWATSTIAPP